MSVRAGYDGFFRMEEWIPVFIHVANEGPAIEGELRITINNAGSEKLTYTSPVSLPTKSNKRVVMYVLLPSFRSRITVHLYDDEGNRVHSANSELLKVINSDELLYGVVTSDPSEFSVLENAKLTYKRASAAFLTLDELPENGVAWRALNVVVLDDVDTSQLTNDQRQAMLNWVSDGGQLVVTGGAGWQKTAVPLADILPVTVTGSQSIETLPALETATNQPFRDPGPYLVAISTLRNGELIFHQDGLPLLARRSLGRGSVFFLAPDPKLPPLADWDGSVAIWEAVLSQISSTPFWRNGVQNMYAAGTAVTALPSLALPSVPQIALFLFAYVIIIGPVNYHILKRFNRRELAWLTIPAIIIFFSGLSYLVGNQMRGTNIILNQLNVAYGQLDAPTMKVQSIIGLYSPQRHTYDLTLPPNSLIRPFDYNFGTTISGGNIRDIQYSNNIIVNDIRTDISEIKTFLADTYIPAPNITGQATIINKNGTLNLEITIQNNSDLTLENAAILMGSTAYSLGHIPPGSSTTHANTFTTSLTSPTYTSFAPLSENAHILLGTSNYYSDREVFPRWQLLQAIETSSRFPGNTLTANNDRITLIAWTNQTLMDIQPDTNNYETIGTTLYLLDIPLTNTFVQTTDNTQSVTIDPSLLNWRVLSNSTVYEINIYNLYLDNGWVQFSYKPWDIFKEFQAEELIIVVESSDVTLPVSVSLWNWEQRTWEELENLKPGANKINNPAPYIGPGNEVQIEIRATTGGVSIDAIYPLLTGQIKN
ncbi:MAG: hypothetical protein D6706_12165 [Chloroflexi bacterium]|nr:MAG: hypothetical protein D6706_12165 [Chloroflexota bacterium]